MVFITMAAEHLAPLAEWLRERNILISAGTPLRLVTHLDITSQDIDMAAAAIRGYFTATKKDKTILTER